MLMRDSQQHGVKSNHRLSSANVALQETVHGDFTAQIDAYLVDRAPLGLSEIERKESADSSVDLGVAGQTRCTTLCLQVFPTHGKCELKDQQLLKYKSTSRFVKL